MATSAGIDEIYVENYGRDKAKINLDIFESLKDRPDGKLILVTAITPTKYGEGKTTMSIALHDGLRKLGQNSMLALREPSLGPVFGIKGGATGGGKASIIPSEDINLHFTGDLHALTSSINLISAVLENHIFRGNALRIDPKRILWKRALDMNDRSLRDIEVCLDSNDGQKHRSGFVITVASELMAILCLATNKDDFIARINRILVAYDLDNNPVYLKDLRISHAIYKLMKEALKPNLVQTLEGNPVLIHGGPFANIAHGCNSIIATSLALKLGDYVVTEAGFGADLGAEKFLDIKMRVMDKKPSAVVMVATIKALLSHGNGTTELERLQSGILNLKHHLENIKKYQLTPVVAINHFVSDEPELVAYLKSWCEANDYLVSFVDSFLMGSDGATDLARKVLEVVNKKSHFKFLYQDSLSIKQKIVAVSKRIYGASKVKFLKKARQQLQEIERLNLNHLMICMAKTPLSLSDDPSLVGTPKNFVITIRDLTFSLGAGFIVAITGKILTMPGLPLVPLAVKMEDESI
ncbi:MAG: formate--tetrahydrofolate ligase [Erysipelotrichaceae bacterium]|nr:formate--tetrahydrofolate ligase [Erysipelotrichaceae bacterium]